MQITLVFEEAWYRVHTTSLIFVWRTRKFNVKRDSLTTTDVSVKICRFGFK